MSRDNVLSKAMSYPALKGEVVTQAHADYCAEFGHATNTRDGVVQPYCPRCGDVAHPEAFPSREEGNRLWAERAAAEAAETAEVHAEEAVHTAAHTVTITAAVHTVDGTEETDPVSVTVYGAEFLAASAVTDIGQEALNSFYGSYQHPFLAVRPDEVTETTVLELVKR